MPGVFDAAESLMELGSNVHLLASGFVLLTQIADAPSCMRRTCRATLTSVHLRPVTLRKASDRAVSAKLWFDCPGDVGDASEVPPEKIHRPF